MDFGRRYETLVEFVEQDVIPAECIFEAQVAEAERRTGSRWAEYPPVMEQLKTKAKSLGLWNLFMPKGHEGSAGVSMKDYAIMSEVMGRSFLAPEACNCNAPDTGNMEVLAKYGSKAQRERWLTPLLEGKIRSAFLMTEPDVASSDATNIECSIRALPSDEGGGYVVNGRKWWSTGAGDPRCAITIVMGRMEGPNWGDGSRSLSRHGRHSMVLIPLHTAGVKVERELTVFGYDDAPHGHAEVSLTDVRVPRDAILLGEGRGFEIAQGRLGPGRVHHCMRAIGLAERALAAAVVRTRQRRTFGKLLSENEVVRHQLAESRMDIAQARLLVLDCAEKLETLGLKGAIQEVSMIKVVVPRAACQVIDRAIQIHGGMGVSQDSFLASAYAHMRTLRIADGPDEVHIRSVAKQELAGRDEERAGARGLAQLTLSRTRAGQRARPRL